MTDFGVFEWWCAFSICFLSVGVWILDRRLSRCQREVDSQTEWLADVSRTLRLLSAETKRLENFVLSMPELPELPEPLSVREVVQKILRDAVHDGVEIPAELSTVLCDGEFDEDAMAADEKEMRKQVERKDAQ